MHIFAKYCSPPATVSDAERMGKSLMVPPPGSYMSDAMLDQWAKDTNGNPFSDDAKEELKEFLDVTDAGCLTCVCPSL